MKIINHYISIHSAMKYAEQFKPTNDKQEIINLITNWRIKSEVIGQWLYCFTTDLIGVQLLSIGFWFSKKHQAFIYSGTDKEGLSDNESLDEIRVRFGSRKI
ncbi:MAG: hypothetical protein FWC12_11775 [Treponema sp.]|nr:hypothetical protein [Treponema sp.]